MNWLHAESEGFRRNAMVDDEEDEEHQRYLALQAAATAEQGATTPQNDQPTRSISAARLPVAAGMRVGEPVEAVRTRELLEREHARRQASVGAATGIAARRDKYITGSSLTGPRACASTADAWAEIGQNSAQQAREARDFLSQWGDVLR